MNKDAARLRALGVHDAETGLPIDSFYELPLDRHTEALRAEYEIGYRSVQKQITPQVDTEGEWGAIYRREIAESTDPIVRLADRIIYHCATVTPHTKDNRGLDSNKTYVLAVRNAIKAICEYGDGKDVLSRALDIANEDYNRLRKVVPYLSEPLNNRGRWIQESRTHYTTRSKP